MPSQIIFIGGISGVGKTSVLGQIKKINPALHCVQSSTVLRDYIRSTKITWPRLTPGQQQSVREKSATNVLMHPGILVIDGHYSAGCRNECIVPHNILYVTSLFVLLTSPDSNILERRFTDKERQRPVDAVNIHLEAIREKWVAEQVAAKYGKPLAIILCVDPALCAKTIVQMIEKEERNPK